MSRRDRSDRFPLPKDDIIRSSGEISDVFRRGRRFTGSFVSVFYTFHPPGDRSRVRVAFTVSRKVSRAADRNRLKRLMREAYRLKRERAISIIEAGGGSSSFVFSCIHARPAATISLKDIEKDFEQFLLRVSSDIAG